MSREEFKTTTKVYVPANHRYNRPMISVEVPFEEHTKVVVIVRPVEEE